jgi:hypothetical protein
MGVSPVLTAGKLVDRRALPSLWPTRLIQVNGAREQIQPRPKGLFK